jgi:LysR family transcriptional activator of nhaA
MYYRRMDWLNYHHLRYFWVVAREGSIAKASVRLRVAQPTISGQLRMLEDALGQKLFRRAGRGLALTDAGRTVFGYAEEIFPLGQELLDALQGRASGRPVRFTVGVADVVPKLVSHRVLSPVLALPDPVVLEVREDRSDRLFAELAGHSLDLVLTDAPLPPGAKIKAFNHVLGECHVSVFGSPPLAKAHQKGFPKSLEGAPFLLPSDDSALRRTLDGWFERAGVHPRTVAEFEDSALLKVFGRAGAGLFVAPSVIEADVARQYDVVPIGKLKGVREQFFAVSVERRLRHPAVLAVTQAARNVLFG